MQINRRNFALGSAGAFAFAGLVRHAEAQTLSGTTTAPVDVPRGDVFGYGPLVEDKGALLDLPPGFTYRVVSRVGDKMADGWHVPDNFDGMGAFDLGRGQVALVRNHELHTRHFKRGPEREGTPAITAAYDHDVDGRVIPGGTTTIVWDTRSNQRTMEHLSLVGTIRNCAGGTTPWASWLSCEETMEKAGQGVAKDHGWIFEVPARHRGLVSPVALTDMGRFNHEAAAIDPRTGIAYLTEDRGDGLFYRFLPNAKGQLAKGGRLQALVVDGLPDSRNWTERALTTMTPRTTRWVDMDGTHAPDDDLRKRGGLVGGTAFARGEGIWMGRDHLYFACTSGGAAKLGQIFRYRPAANEGANATGGALDLVFESPDSALMNYCDNITIAPNGHLIVCEDRSGSNTVNYLRGLTPAGQAYPFARLRIDTELAGACFSPDGRTLFVNVYAPGATLAITGPWKSVRV